MCSSDLGPSRPLIRTCWKPQFWQLFSTRTPGWKFRPSAKEVACVVSYTLESSTFTKEGARRRVVSLRFAEWDAHRKGTSWKAKLKAAIDTAIPQAKDFDDFLRLLQEQGYEAKRGKYVSFRAPGQERFTRCKTLGEAYTEEAIIERIKEIGRAHV